MVSFQCARCGDVVKKPKVPGHAMTCRTPGFSCVDCMENFDLDTVKKHNACMTEAHRYQGQWRQATNGAEAVKSAPAVDSEEEEERARGVVRAPAHPQKRRRPTAADFTTSSDDDDADAKKKIKKPTGASQKHKSEVAVATSPAALVAVPSPKHPPIKKIPSGADEVVHVHSFEVNRQQFLETLENICDVDGDGSGSIAIKAAAAELATRYRKRLSKELEKTIRQALARTHGLGSATVTLDEASGVLSRI
jgi:cell growth-regulating nucleolar protein